MLLAWGLAWAEGSPPPSEAAFLRCREVVGGLEVQALYQGEGATLVLLGKGRPLLLVALEEGRPLPHAGPPRGKPMARRPFPFLRELSLARRVVVLAGEYRCFVLHRGRVVGVLRLGPDLEPLPLFPPPEGPPAP
ncbi:hypothetical protein TCCBUS3UF1_5800 [Thermus sp. CCB_US3_UF1]|nr:hypothetical protein TCCBUS3UF1_5800 [Thermus sp. CCB_US3_UF1]